MGARETIEAADAALERDQYERLRRESLTHRERLVVRLAGEVGLRPREMTRLRPADVEPTVVDGSVHYFLDVDEGDGRRTAYLPRPLERELTRYVRSRGIDDDDRVFDVTPRRLQMLVSEVADRAAAATGDESLREVSSADLRRYLARDLLVERSVPPSVVLATGGWSRLESFEPLIEDPTPAEMAAALDRAAAPETGADRGSRERQDDRPYRDALDRLDRGAVLLDRDATVAFANRRFEGLTGRSAADVTGGPLGSLLTPESAGLAEVLEAITGGDGWTGDVTVESRRGDPVGAWARVEPMRVAEGGPRWFLLTVDVGPASEAEHGDGERTVGRMEHVQSAVRSAGRALGEATTRAELLQQACDRLAESDAYALAWFDAGGDEPGAFPRTGAGEVDAVSQRPAIVGRNDDAVALFDRVIRRRSTETAEVDVEGSDGEGPRTVSVIGVPVVDGDSVYGALCVGTTATGPTAFEQSALAGLGERVGQMLTAVERKRLMLADTVLEIELRCTDQRSFLVAASEDLGCTLRLEGIVPVGGTTLLYYVTATETTPDRVLEVADDVAGGARIIADHSDESLLEVTVADGALANAVVECGGSVVSMAASDGEARVTGEFAPETDVREVLDTLGDGFPHSEFVARREVNRSALTPSDYRRSLEDRLTDKQRAVLQAAYHAGYFDWPRGSTAEELADSMDVSSPTLHNHLRRAQRKLLDSFFSEPNE